MRIQNHAALSLVPVRRSRRQGRVSISAAAFRPEEAASYAAFNDNAEPSSPKTSIHHDPGFITQLIHQYSEANRLYQDPHAAAAACYEETQNKTTISAYKKLNMAA
ncbi:MAG: hypothetical protein AB7G80_00480 [Dongiaceae bacterium]